MMNKILIILISSLLLNGCSTVRGMLKKIGLMRTSHNVDFSVKLKQGEFVYISNIKILYDAVDITRKCNMNFDNLWADGIALEKEGDLFLASPASKLIVGRVICRMSSFKQVEFRFADLYLDSPSRRKTIYVGDMVLSLNSKKPFQKELVPEHLTDLVKYNKVEGHLKVFYNKNTKIRFEKLFGIAVLEEKMISIPEYLN